MSSLVTEVQTHNTAIEGCRLIEYPVHQDNRGAFMPVWSHDTRYGPLDDQLFRQLNVSTSSKGVMRGLHIQSKKPQGKLVHCPVGIIYDVCVDLRPESPTFMQWVGIQLHAGRSLYLPPGTAHGFFAMSEAVVAYQCTEYHDPKSDTAIDAFDPRIGIKWPSLVGIHRSDRDMAGITAFEYTQKRM